MIKYVEYLETNGSQAGWILDGSMTASTDVLYFDFMPLSGSVNYDAFWVFLDKDSCYEIRCNVYDRTNIRFSKGNPTKFFNITYGERYNVVFGSAVTINGNVLIENPNNPINSNPMCVNCWNQAFYGEVNNIYRAQRARYYGVKLTDSNGNVLREWKPCINDDNNSVGFYETVTQTYVAQTGSGTTTIGPYLSTIIVNADRKAVPASGGTINVTVNSDTPWSATSTGSWYTMSQTAGTENDTAITITVPSTTAATQAEDTITFTNENGDTDQLAIKQRKYSAGGIRLIDLGADEVETFYIGNEQVEVIYMGEEVVYQAGEFIGLKMKSDVAIQMGSGSTYDLKIKSSEPWTLSVDTAVTWLEFSQLTGGTGETIVTITATEDNQTGDNRATTITATTANYSATCVITQSAVIYVDYIHETTLTANTKHFIDTLVMHTTGTSFRVKGIVKYGNGEVIVGYQTSDNSDYRLFWTDRKPYYDINSRRLENYPQMPQDSFVDFYCYNYGFSLNGNTLGTGQTQTSITAPETIKVDVGSWWLQSLEIWDGETKVFDGHAAVEDNVIGLYDSITESMFTNSSYTLTTEDINLDLYSINVPQTDAHITIGSDTYYKYDKTQGYYEMYSNEKVIGVLTRRYNGSQICVLKDVDNNFSYSLKSNNTNIEIYSQGGSLLTTLESGSSTIINGMKISNYVGSSGKQIHFETTNAMWEIRQIA